MSRPSHKPEIPACLPTSHIHRIPKACWFQLLEISLIYFLLFTPPLLLGYRLSASLTWTPAMVSSMLFLHVVARELFKISFDYVTVRLQPFCGFPLPLRWPSRSRVPCSCLLLWPHLSPASLLSRHLDLLFQVQASSVLEALWHDILPSLNAPNPVSPPKPHCLLKSSHSPP